MVYLSNLNNKEMVSSIKIRAYRTTLKHIITEKVKGAFDNMFRMYCIGVTQTPNSGGGGGVKDCEFNYLHPA